MISKDAPPRLWPYVLAGLICSLLMLAYLEPIPESTTPEVSVGPESPLYGPLKGRGQP